MSTDNPTLSSREIGQRVLALIDSLRSARDLSPERIERATGLTVEFDAGDRNVYGVSGALGGAWSYALVSAPDRQDQPPRSLRFSLEGATADADPAPVCMPTFAEYTRALTDMGFAGEPMRAFPGSEAWHFNRGDINVMAYPRGGEGGQCLSRLIISAGA